MNNVLTVDFGTDFEEEIDQTLERLKNGGMVLNVDKIRRVGDSIRYKIEFSEIEGAFLFGKTRPQIKL